MHSDSQGHDEGRWHGGEFPSDARYISVAEDQAQVHLKPFKGRRWSRRQQAGNGEEVLLKVSACIDCEAKLVEGRRAQQQLMGPGDTHCASEKIIYVYYHAE